MPTYQPGIPTGTVNLDVDYQNIQDNFQQLNVAYGVDHVAFSDNSGVPPRGITGMHNIIHLRSNATPASLLTVGQLFSADVNDGLDTDTILYFLTGKNKLLQLTSNLQPTRATNGYTFLPGGVILQWGTITAVSQTLTPVTYTSMGNIAFPNNTLNVQTTIKEGASSGANVLNISAISATGFSYYNTSSSSRDFFWTAIGY